MKLKFSKANAKTKYLGKNVYSLDLSAGYACPFADKCKSCVVLIDGKPRIKDGQHCEYRCFSASQEVLYTNLRKLRQYNFNLLKKYSKSKKQIEQLLQKSLPEKAEIIRYHVAGDFFCQNYFDAAINLAKKNPHILFYAYTKSIGFWIKRKPTIPPNFILTASYGGKQDNLISKHKLRFVKVVLSSEEAKKLKLPLDHNDGIASSNSGNFALLLHGPQKANTIYSKAWQALKKINQAGYKR